MNTIFENNLFEQFIDGLQYKPVWSDSLYFEIFKNPALDEVKQNSKIGVLRGVGMLRGWIDTSGDMYTAIGRDKNGEVQHSDYMHYDLMHMLNKVGVNVHPADNPTDFYNDMDASDVLEDGLLVMIWNTGNVYEGESYQNSFFENNLGKVDELLDRAALKNPSFIFKS